MTPQKLYEKIGSRRANLVLATLFLGAFVMGSSELLVVGLLNVIASDLQISIPTAGGFVTANALGLAIGGPVLTAMTIKLNKRAVLFGSLVLFILSNLGLVVTGSYHLAILMRGLAGAGMGLFIAVGFVVGTAIVPPKRMGRAISVVITGVTVSTALGVPAGTLVGQALGWRGSFVTVVVLACLALLAAVALVPSVPGTGRGAAGQARYAFAPPVLAILAQTLVAFVALFSALTYIVPYLESVTGVSGALIGVFLLAYGAATVVGSFGGGRFADVNAARALVIASIGVSASLLALYLVGATAVLALVALVALGVFGYSMPPSLQYRAIHLAGPGGQLASSLPVSAANIGIALGSVVGGAAIGAFDSKAAVIVSLVVALICIPIALGTSLLRGSVAEDASRPEGMAEPDRASV